MILPILTAAALFEGTTLVARYSARARLFKAAQARSQETGQPLIVVGAPDAGGMTAIFGAPYGCGDLCIDLNGCPNCQTQVKVDLGKDQIPVAGGSAVVFVSCVLEYVDDIEAAWKELRRVAGENLFVAIVGGGTLTSYAFPGAKWILAPTETGFTATRISNDPRDGSSMFSEETL